MSDHILSQEEINALLAAIDEEESGHERAAFTHGEDSGEPRLKKYDFLRPDKFSKDQLRTLQMMHDTFGRNLQTELAGLMRIPVQVEVLSVAEMMYEEFIEQLSNPSILNIVSLESVGGSIVIEINPALGFMMLDRLLGGPGTPPKRARALTEIEQTLIRRIVERMLGALEDAWQPVSRLGAQYQRTEMNPQFVQVVPPQDMTVVISFRVRMKEAYGRMNLCLPYVCLEPVAPKLKAQVWFASNQPGERGGSQEILQERLANLKLRLTVELGEGTISIGDFVNLQVGDVIQLDKDVHSPLAVRIGNRKKFLARPGRIGSRLAVEVLEAIREDD